MRARLFTGVYPAGLVYCDTGVEEDGDYQKVAFLSYSTLELTVYRPKSPVISAVQESAREMQARRGQQFRTSQCGSSVVLGGRRTQ